MDMLRSISLPVFFLSHAYGVEDFTRGSETRLDRRRFVYKTIDNAGFQGWVVFVAAIGFLTDAYDIFALSSVSPMLGYVYWNSPVLPHPVQTGLQCATLVGTLVGQVSFGFLADRYGRQKMYGLELLITIFATLALTMSSSGESCSMSLIGWLVVWRFAVGLGIGADYPLSACITAEFAPRRWRTRMMAVVFFMQPLGQLLGNLVSLAVLEAYRGSIDEPRPGEVAMSTCYWDARSGPRILSQPSIQRLDSIWRLIIGLGAVPAILAIFFRFTIPESPRYLLDVRNETSVAVSRAKEFYCRHVVQTSNPGADQHDGQAADALNGRPLRLRSSSDDMALAIPLTPSAVMQIDAIRPVSVAVTSEPRAPSIASSASDPSGSAREREKRPATEVQALEPDPQDSAHDYFITQGNWKTLLGTSMSWLLLDLPFYGLGLSSQIVTRVIWYGDDKSRIVPNVQGSAISALRYLVDGPEHLLLLQSVGAIIGGLLIILLIWHKFSTWRIQFWGFLCLTALLILTGGVMIPNTGTAPIVLYVILQAAFNLGPNPTTYIIAAELYPTKWRGTCHGLSAAAGRVGAIAAQIFVGYVGWDRHQVETPDKAKIGYILMVLSIFTALGALVTWLLIPHNIQDERHMDRALEVLAQGRKGGKSLALEQLPDD